jgi:hypothetical protein
LNKISGCGLLDPAFLALMNSIIRPIPRTAYFWGTTGINTKSEFVREVLVNKDPAGRLMHENPVALHAVG